MQERRNSSAVATGVELIDKGARHCIRNFLHYYHSRDPSFHLHLHLVRKVPRPPLTHHTSLLLLPDTFFHSAYPYLQRPRPSAPACVASVRPPCHSFPAPYACHSFSASSIRGITSHSHSELKSRPTNPCPVLHLRKVSNWTAPPRPSRTFLSTRDSIAAPEIASLVTYPLADRFSFGWLTLILVLSLTDGIYQYPSR